MFPKHRITGDQTEIPRRIFFASEFKFISLGRHTNKEWKHNITCNFTLVRINAHQFLLGILKSFLFIRDLKSFPYLLQYIPFTNVGTFDCSPWAEIMTLVLKKRTGADITAPENCLPIQRIFFALQLFHRQGV